MKRQTLVQFLVFIAVSAIVLGSWWYIETTFFKPAERPKVTEPAKAKPDVKPFREPFLAVLGAAATKTEPLAANPSRFVYRPPAIEETNSEPHRLIALGGPGYNLDVILTSLGGGVQSTALPAFDHATRLGEEAKTSDGKPYPLQLIPGLKIIRRNDTVTDDVYPELDGKTIRQLAATEPGKAVDARFAKILGKPSYVLLHYPAAGDPDRFAENPDVYPSSLLERRTWKVTREQPGSDTADAEVDFETILEAPYFVKITKTFSLNARDYHVRMKLRFAGIEGQRSAVERDRAPLRYQIVGPHGLPIECEWSTGTYRNAYVGWRTPTGYGKRDLQDSRHIFDEHGGTKIEAQGNTFTYAGVVTQFFTSAMAPEPEEQAKNYWEYVRATREDSPGVPEDKPMLGDITVRAASNKIDPAPGQTIEHRYWIYAGPTKVRLLNKLDLLESSKHGFKPNDGLVDRYLNEVTLNTLTDAPSPTWFGRLADSLYWTSIIIWFTNLMHDVLSWLHGVVPIWGVNILMLTVLVRLLLMVPSRRQQAGMMKLQEKMAALKPEIDKITEKYKGDPQRLNQEKTRLMLQHGVNPISSMGGCLLMFAQMPIFMGLYFCLQESIFFRLDRFLWIRNLAAPDMLLWWTEAVPYLTAAPDLGGMVFVGPFLNILPIVSVTLMFINFKISSPPPTDEQQEMQQKTMKYMMIFMAFFFYKMAAGLCLYFIVSTAWGLVERKLLKKKKKDASETNTALDTPPEGTSRSGAKQVPAEPPANPGFLGKFKAKLMERMEEIQRQADTQRQIVNNPQPPKPGGTSQPSTTPAQRATDRKKKRKKK